jgi:predicted DCC family thiol-disulfide oxidoreductase YuxK
MPETLLTVFFDGGCPLCSREIKHYQKWAGQADITWIDVTRQAERLPEYGLSQAEAMARFHVMDGSRMFHRGADGFLLLWSRLPGYRHLANACKMCHIQPLLRWVYEHFARWHFRRRCPEGHCTL